MPNVLADRKGFRHGWLTYLMPVKGKRDKQGNQVWNCRCDCGKDVERSGYKKAWKSCGCRKGYRSFDLKGLPKSVISNYKYSAKKRGYEYDLTEEEAVELFESDCFYCGDPPSNAKKDKDRVYLYNGIDRLDNSRGYYSDNVVSCCHTCNKMKMDLSYSEFIDHIAKIFNY